MRKGSTSAGGSVWVYVALFSSTIRLMAGTGKAAVERDGPPRGGSSSVRRIRFRARVSIWSPAVAMLRRSVCNFVSIEVLTDV